ncbi:S-layer homology domain-containing protein [Salibacterium lacus]|uniref:S-layer homology domain-containing protein n=1 Tax=Salibacterium lacus TaxID=1898109 RepID=A0ABW5T658_9BACI
MAYQPKSYRRFLASSVSAAVVASAAAAVPADVQQADAAESFSDVSNDYWASESIQRLADEGIINGYPDGTYGPGEEINRGQVASLLVKAFDLETNENAESSYDDLNDDSYFTPVAEAVTEAGYITGREDGTMFAPGMELSREQMATILVRAFNLEPKEDSDANVADLDEANASHQENIQILADYDITSTENNMFNPKETVNRAQFATFLDRALEVQEPLEIANVSTLTGDGHVLSVEFTRPYREDIDASDVRIAESDSGERKGVESVRLAPDGLSAEVTLYDDTSDNAPDEIPEGVQHDIQVGDLETTFTRDSFLNDDDNARVTSVNDDDREFTVTYNEDNGDGDETSVTLDVPEDSDFNFQQALGHEISVWYDGDNNLTNYELIQHEDTVNTAIEVTANDEIETVDGGDAHDLADDVTFIVNDGSDDEIVAEGTDEVEEEGLVNEEYDYSKVIFNDNGDVERVYAYNFNEDPILTESVDGSLVIGKDNNELDLEDYRVVKDGQQIAAEDVQEGDVVYFNEDAYDGDGFAVVSTNTMTGEIDSIFDDSFDVDGTNYSYENDAIGNVQYLDDEGEFANLDEDAAEELQAAGEVTLYTNFKGDLVYVTGDVEDVEQSYDAFYLQGQPTSYVSSSGDDMVELEGVNAEGNSYLYEFAPDSLEEITVQTSDGEVVYETDENYPETETEIDEFALATGSADNPSLIDQNSGPISEDTFLVALDGDGNIINDEAITPLSAYVSDIGSSDYTNNLINVGEDENGNVQNLEFFDNVETLEEEIDEDSDYANGNLLEDDTLVYDVSDADEEYTDPDEDDVSITTWGDLKENGVDVSADSAAVYSDEDDRATHLVTYEDVISDGEEYTAVIKDIQTSDGDVVRADVLVNGEEVSYDVNDVDSNVSEGDVVEIEVNDANDLITGFNDLGARIETGTVQEGGVSVSDNEVTLDSGETFELANDGAVYDASDNDADDYSVENLRDIEDGDSITVAKPSDNSSFADAFVITGEDDTETGGGDVETDGEVTYINPGSWSDSSDVVVEVEDDEGNFVEYSRADGDMSSSVASFLYNNQGVIDGSDIQFSFNDNDDISGVSALSLNEDNASANLTIPASAAFDGLVVEGNENEVQNVTVEADNVTIRHTVMNDLTVNGDDFTSEENTINGNLTVKGSDSEFNTTINGNVTVDGSASFSNVEFASSTTIDGSGSVTLDGTVGDLDATNVNVEDNDVDFAGVEDEDFSNEYQGEVNQDTVDAAFNQLDGMGTQEVTEDTNVITFAESVLEENNISDVSVAVDSGAANSDGELNGSTGDTGQSVTYQLSAGDVTQTATVNFDIVAGGVSQASSVTLNSNEVVTPSANDVTVDISGLADENNNNIDGDFAVAIEEQSGTIPTPSSQSPVTFSGGDATGITFSNVNFENVEDGTYTFDVTVDDVKVGEVDVEVDGTNPEITTVDQSTSGDQAIAFESSEAIDNVNNFTSDSGNASLASSFSSGNENATVEIDTAVSDNDEVNFTVIDMAGNETDFVATWDATASEWTVDESAN